MTAPSGPPEDDSAALAEAKQVVEWMIQPRTPSDYQGFGASLFEHATPVAATLWPVTSVTFRLTIPPEYANRQQQLHGGAAAMIFDNLSSVVISLWAVAVAPEDSELGRQWVVSGLSRSLNCSYVRPAPVGSTVLVRNEVVSVGKRMALVRSTISDSTSGKVMVTCEHHKVAVDVARPAL